MNTGAAFVESKHMLPSIGVVFTTFRPEFTSCDKFKFIFWNGGGGWEVNTSNLVLKLCILTEEKAYLFLTPLHFLH